MTDSKTKISKILEIVNIFKSWKWQNLIILALFIVGMAAVICFSGVTNADADRIDALNSRIEALNSTIESLTARLVSYEKILDYRIENLEEKMGIKYKEGNGQYEKIE